MKDLVLLAASFYLLKQDAARISLSPGTNDASHAAIEESGISTER